MPIFPGCDAIVSSVSRVFAQVRAAAALGAPEVLRRQPVRRRAALVPQAGLTLRLGESVAMQDVHMLRRQDQPRLARVYEVAARRKVIVSAITRTRSPNLSHEYSCSTCPAPDDRYRAAVACKSALDMQRLHGLPSSFSAQQNVLPAGRALRDPFHPPARRRYLLDKAHPARPSVAWPARRGRDSCRRY